MNPTQKRQTILSILLIVSVLISGYLLVTVQKLQEVNESLQTKQIKLSESLTDMSALNSESSEMIKKLTIEVQKINSEKLELQNDLNNTLTLDELSKQRLKAMGYEDYSLILNDLNHHNNLIPFEGVLGGSMAWRPENAVLLNDKWVYATFDDGHIDGTALLTFKIDNNKTISWEIVDIVLNN
ncbi:MAG: hypothetical protein JXO44_11155 [Clostridia bacterium]|nr:hypothetical protein [Clostridia bacterium]